MYYCVQIESVISPLWETIIVAPDLPRCHYGDSGCLAKVIPMYAKGLKSGRRDLNFVPLDPLQVNEVDIVQGAQSPVNINLKFRDMQCYGLSMVQIKDIE